MEAAMMPGSMVMASTSAGVLVCLADDLPDRMSLEDVAHEAAHLVLGTDEEREECGRLQDMILREISHVFRAAMLP
jgi:hypothetical protein